MYHISKEYPGSIFGTEVKKQFCYMEGKPWTAELRNDSNVDVEKERRSETEQRRTKKIDDNNNNIKISENKINKYKIKLIKGL